MTDRYDLQGADDDEDELGAEADMLDNEEYTLARKGPTPLGNSSSIDPVKAPGGGDKRQSTANLAWGPRASTFLYAAFRAPSSTRLDTVPEPGVLR